MLYVYINLGKNQNNEKEENSMISSIGLGINQIVSRSLFNNFVFKKVLF